jgi:predicted HicB family RNase H-like nuclease
MSAPKPFASLGSTLLARKGGARPAMRPQLVPMSALGSPHEAEACAADLEDLGWNDMGEPQADLPEPHRPGTLRPGRAHDVPFLALTPAPANPDDDAATRLADSAAHAELGGSAAPAATIPEVLRQRRAAAAELAGRATAKASVPGSRASGSASAAGTARATRRKALEAGRRAAFTLRLDARRHLMLRLASTVQNSSAQQLVTAALDQYLAEIPDIETLADQVKRDRHDR